MKKLLMIFILSLFVVGLLLPTNLLAQASPWTRQISPEDHAIVQDNPINFIWESDITGKKYNLMVLNESYDTVVAVTTSSPSYTAALFINKKYYWRVKTEEEFYWSYWYTFTVKRSGVPGLVSPVDGATDLQKQITCDWSDATNAQKYWLQIDNNSNFSSPAINVDDLSATDYKVPFSKLGYGTKYYWRVCAYINSEYWEHWSVVNNFTVISDVPNLTSPENDAADLVLPVRIDWSAVNGIEEYYYQIDDNANFGSPEKSGTTDRDHTYYDADGLAGGTKYYWRVRTGYHNTDAIHVKSSWSSVWSFTIGEQTDINVIENDLIPGCFVLKQNYPNPFNPATTIEFALPGAAFVTLDIHNILGKKVETLVSRPMSAGSYSVIWDASSVPSGIYFYKIDAGAFSETKKMTLIK